MIQGSFSDDFLIRALLEPLLPHGPGICVLGRLAVCSTLWRDTVDSAARQAIKRLCPQATPLLTRPYLAHWALISILEKSPEALDVVSQALTDDDCSDCSDGSALPRLSCALARQAVNDLTDRCSFCETCPTARVLGADGPLQLLPLQRRLLRRLAFDAGATRGGVHLAQQAVAKALAQRSPMLREVLLDVAELLNLRAYARTYVSSRPRVLSELEEALSQAAHAMDCSEELSEPEGQLTPLRGTVRARLLLGRTLSSAAHSLALSYMQGAARDRLLARWGSPQKMFELAEQQLRCAIAEVSRQGEPALFSEGILCAALGECFFCQASAARENADHACKQCLKYFRHAFRCLQQAGKADTIQFADALKDYGKVLKCGVLAENNAAAGELALRKALHTHRRLLGSDHPCTRNVCRLLDGSDDTDSASDWQVPITVEEES